MIAFLSEYISLHLPPHCYYALFQSLLFNNFTSN